MDISILQIRVLFPIFFNQFYDIDDKDSSGTDHWCEIHTELKIQNYQKSCFQRSAKPLPFYISKISYKNLHIPGKKSFGVQASWFRKFEGTKINMDSEKREIFI